MAWQSKSKQTKIWLPDISSIFLTQIPNFNQFRQGEVWWKFWPQSQDMITLLYWFQRFFIYKLTSTYWVGIRGCPLLFNWKNDLIIFGQNEKTSHHCEKLENRRWPWKIYLMQFSPLWRTPLFSTLLFLLDRCER